MLQQILERVEERMMTVYMDMPELKSLCTAGGQGVWLSVSHIHNNMVQIKCICLILW